MSSRAQRRAANRAQEGESSDVSEVPSEASSRRSRRSRPAEYEDDAKSTGGLSTSELADNLESRANQAEIASALGKMGERFKKKKKREEIVQEDEVIVPSETKSGLESGIDLAERFGKDTKNKDNSDGDDFACWHCNKNLLGYRFVNREGHPYCVSCYHDLFANKCEDCKLIISVDSQDLAFKEKHWHDSCFKCSQCDRSLVEQNFGLNENKERLFCTDCYEREYAPRCNKCDEPFKTGVLKLNWNGANWHADCFQCCNCNKVIGKDSFHPQGNKPYCNNCWDELFAIKCTKCTEPIKASGITYRMEPYHRDCFVCTECDDVLAGQRFTLVGDNAVCAECYGRNHAHKCFECQLPIKGDSGNRYIMFEDVFWHCECFFCQECNTSLLGSNFVAIGSGDDIMIYCQPCGFQRKGWSYDDVITGRRIDPKEDSEEQEGSEEPKESKRKKKGLLDKLEKTWDNMKGKDRRRATEKDTPAQDESSPPATPTSRRRPRKF